MKKRRTSKASPEIAWFKIDRQGRFADVNAAWLRMHGFRAKKEILGKPFTATQKKEDIPAARKIVRQLLAGEHIPHGEFSRRKKDGSIGYHTFSVGPIVDGGTVTGLEGYLIDTTEQHRTADRNRESEENFRALFENSPSVMWENDFSAILTYLKKRGIGRVKNYRRFFEKHPDTAVECLKLIKVINVNRAGVKLYRARSKKQLITSIPQLVPPPAVQETVSGICALLEGKSTFSTTTVNTTLKGDALAVNIQWQLLSGTAVPWSRIIVTVEDITAQEHTRQQLAASEERYRLLAENASDVIWTMDLHGQLQYVSPSVRKFRGYTPAQMMQQNLRDMLSPNSYAESAPKLNALRTVTGHPGTTLSRPPLRLEFRHKNGTTVWGENSMNLLFGKDGSPEVLIGVTRDVTVQMRMERELNAAKERAEKYLNVAARLIVGLDTRGRITLLNEEGARLLECDRREMTGKPWFTQFVPPDSRKRVRAAFSRIIAGELETAEYYDNDIQTVSGKRLTIHWHNSLVRDTDGNVIGTLSSGEDVTATRHMEQERAESEIKFRLLSEKSPVGVYMTDLDGNCTYANPAWLYMAGMETMEQALGRNWLNALHPDDRDAVADKWYTFIKSGGAWGNEYRFRAPDGRVTWIWGSARKRTDARGRHVGYVGTNVDITDRKLADDELKWELTVHNALSGMARMLVSPDNTLESICEITLKYARGITGCKHGFVSVLDPETNDNIGYTLTSMMPDCPVAGQDRKIRFPAQPDGTHPGLWGHALNTKKGFFTNDPMAHPASKGLPRGHIPLKNFLAVPALADFNLFGEIALAGAPGDLTERDLLAVEQLGHLFALAVQRVRATGALRESEQKYRELFENMQSAFALHRIITDTDGTPVDYEFIEVNPAFLRLTGLTRDDLIGKRVTEALPGTEDDEADWIGRYGRIALQGGQEQFENYSEALDRWYFVTAYSPQPKHFAVIFDDITDRKKAEAALHDSLQVSDDIVRTIPSGMFIYQYEPPDRLVLLDGNAQAEQLTGITIADWTGREFNELWPAARADGTTEAFLNAARTGVTFETEDLNYADDRLTGAFRIRAFKLPGSRLAVAFENVTALKQAEQKLAAQTAYLEGVFRAAPAGIGVVVGRVIKRVNEHLEQMTGYDSSELLGRSSRILYPTDEDYEYVGRVKYRQIGENNSGTVETRWQCKDGHIIDILLSSTPMDSDDLKKGVVFTALDITEKNEAAAEITRSLEEKDILLKEVHHRVKNNMQVISSLLNLQSEYLPDEETKGMLQESRDRIRSMSLVHEQLYQSGDFAHLDIGQYLGALVRSVARTYYRTAGRVRVDVQADGISMPITTAIPCGLIVNELVANAFKHAFPGERTGTVTIHMEQTPEGAFRLAVADDGIGLPADFNFETARSLGLRLVVMLAKHQLEGHLSVDRKNGTAVTVTFSGSEA